MQLELIYFSPTGTTARIVDAIAQGSGITEKRVRALLHTPSEEVVIPHDRLAVLGTPVFSGRVPATFREALTRMKGDQTPVLLVCVYGNRDFDDALVELHDIAVARGFVPVAAAAFVARHSIFPVVGAGRPDTEDLAAARAFGERGAERAVKAGAKSETEAGAGASAEGSAQGLHIRGNRPYREYKRVPLAPRTDRKCDGCGACAKGCPVQAIDPADPRRTNKKLCTACAHCIAICPRQARHFGGLLYRLASRKFIKAYTRRQAPYTVYE